MAPDDVLHREAPQAWEVRSDVQVKTLGIFLNKQLFNILIRSRTVAVGVVNFLIAYIFLLIAFTVSFMIIFPRTESFELLPTAFVKVP